MDVILLIASSCVHRLALWPNMAYSCVIDNALITTQSAVCHKRHTTPREFFAIFDASYYIVNKMSCFKIALVCLLSVVANVHGQNSSSIAMASPSPAASAMNSTYMAVQATQSMSTSVGVAAKMSTSAMYESSAVEQTASPDAKTMGSDINPTATTTPTSPTATPGGSASFIVPSMLSLIVMAFSSFLLHLV